MKNLLFYFLLFLLPTLNFAQIPVIETPAKDGIFKTLNEVSLQKLDLQVKIVGNISTTVATMTFYNNSSRILEGRLTFPLPENVSIAGYALDINGKLRNAVPVEKTKAKEVFETIEKRNVDPGIIEKVDGNNFRTRIYPINPKGSRTVQITYNMELKNQQNNLVYFIPLLDQKMIKDFKLNVSVFENINSPQLEENPAGDFVFVKNGHVWNASISKTDFKPNNNLKISLPQTENGIETVMQPASANNFYFLSQINISSQKISKKKPSEIAVVWDNSLSGLQRNHQKEMDLLGAYFKNLGNVNIKLYTLNNRLKTVKDFKINDGNWEDLKNTLSKINYDGGTDFSELKSISGDEILFFTDGISTFGDLNLSLKQPIYTIVSSPKANFSQLKFIAAKTGGEFINLNENIAKMELSQLIFQSLKFLGIKNNPSVSEVYPSLPLTVSDHFSLVGILNQPQTEIVLQFGFGNKVSLEKTIVLNSTTQSTKDWDISKFWAQKKIAELELFNKKNDEEIKTVGQQFGLVTQNTSLIVLENVQDYVRYKISPPQELRAEYNNITKNNLANLEELRKDLMAKSEEMIENLKKWYATDFKQEKTYPKPKSGVVYSEEVLNEESEPTRSPVIESDSTSENKSLEVEDVVVVARGISSVQSSQRVDALEGRAAGVEISNSAKIINSQIIAKGKITTVEVKSDQEYMKSFEGKNADEIYSEYLKLRPEYISTPSFYFDVAQLLFNKNDKEKAITVLSSVADLDLENEELYKLLAYKLKNQNIYDKEFYITGKVLEWRPFDAQSYRDYALAAEDNGDYQTALDNLYKILTKSYSPEASSRDNGIEETILMEINELISRHSNKLDVSKINKKLIADLPINIRVVLNWNKDSTDIDLWVTDPSGERCIYNHNETAIGGRLSDDFTAGFGPEQFLLKKAIKGKYKIETNFFAETQVSLSGPTAIMAEIYINYATGKQEMKTVVFQRDRKVGSTENQDGVLIGEFEF